MENPRALIQKGSALVATKATSTAKILKQLNSEGRGWILFALAGGWMMVLGIRLVFPALLPQIIEEYAIGNTVAGLIITGISATTALMQFPSGIIGDRAGERLILILSIVAVVAGLGFIVFFPLFHFFLFGCFLFGLGMGAYGTPRVIVLSNVYPRLDGTAIGITFSAGHLGTSLLPFIATLVAIYFTWRVSFLIFIPALIVIIVCLRIFLPKDSKGTSEPGTTSTYRELFSGLSSVLTIPSVILAFLGLSLWGFTFTAITTFLPIYLITEKGFSQPRATFIFSLFFVSGLFTQLVAGGAADTVGYKRVLVAVSGFSILPLIALPFLDGFAVLLIVVMLIGCRLGLVAVNNAYAAAVVPKRFQGTGFGFIRSGEKLLGATGAVFMGLFADSGLLDVGMIIMAVLTAIMTVIYALLSPELSDE